MQPALSPLGKTLITSFGMGLMRPFPGTWGSIPTCALAGLLIVAGVRPCGAGLIPSVVYHSALVIVLIIFSAVCVKFGDGAEVYFGKKDPGSVVADETAGQAIALAALPAFTTDTFWHAVLAVAVAFVAFRICDIIKPWPARGLQKHPGGWGILLDDLAAGVQAAVLVQIALRVVWPRVM